MVYFNPSLQHILRNSVPNLLPWKKQILVLQNNTKKQQQLGCCWVKQWCTYLTFLMCICLLWSNVGQFDKLHHCLLPFIEKGKEGHINYITALFPEMWQPYTGFMSPRPNKLEGVRLLVCWISWNSSYRKFFCSYKPLCLKVSFSGVFKTAS